MTDVITEFSKEGKRQIIKGAIEIVSEEILAENKWLEFKDQSVIGKKTKNFDVISKCSNCILGEIKWYPAWRHYNFFPNTRIETVHSDRCMLQIGFFVMKLNQEHKLALDKARCRKNTEEALK